MYFIVLHIHISLYYLFCALLSIDASNVRAYEAPLWYIIERPQAPPQMGFPRVEHLESVLDPVLDHSVRTAATVAVAVLVTLVYTARGLKRERMTQFLIKQTCANKN